LLKILLSPKAAYDAWGLDIETGKKLFKKTSKLKNKTTYIYDDLKIGLVQPFGGYNLSVKSKGLSKAANLWPWKERKNHKEKIEKIGRAIDKRNADTTEFLIDLQTSYYQDMLNFFHKKLKYKGLITSSNWRGNFDANLLDAERATYRFDDIVDNHHYVSPAHINPNEPGIASWDVRVGDCYQSMSALKAPWIMPNSFKQFSGKPV